MAILDFVTWEYQYLLFSSEIRNFFIQLKTC
jgi:hypothetical protein